ncbi:MAG: hypothetical protein EA350_07065 [Gemmatimonadales bacterium]|nr:MAG: hypothetical protein EA350_07065 [Gemmatimonadales bacterium]
MLRGGVRRQTGEHGVAHAGRKGVGPHTELGNVDAARGAGHRFPGAEKPGEPLFGGHGNALRRHALRPAFGDLALQERRGDPPFLGVLKGGPHARLGILRDLPRQKRRHEEQGADTGRQVPME